MKIDNEFIKNFNTLHEFAITQQNEGVLIAHNLINDYLVLHKQDDVPEDVAVYNKGFIDGLDKALYILYHYKQKHNERRTNNI